ncbi:MAG: hypothetical protein AABX74_04825 [Nanoarchaeota archaeon]
MEATIKDVKLMRIDKIFKKHKPQGLGFSDNDVIVINLKTNDGNAFSQNFYCRLKADGSLGHSITKRSERRQKELQIFIRKYISKDAGYNIRDNINTWKGKEVEAEKINGGFIIKI